VGIHEANGVDRVGHALDERGHGLSPFSRRVSRGA
jgi:hypothetical protein